MNSISTSDIDNALEFMDMNLRSAICGQNIYGVQSCQTVIAVLEEYKKKLVHSNNYNARPPNNYIGEEAVGYEEYGCPFEEDIYHRK